MLNRASRGEIEARARQIEKIETAVDPDFQKHFVAAMGIPHSSHSYPLLASAVQLPPVQTRNATLAGNRSGVKRRGRRRVRS